MLRTLGVEVRTSLLWSKAADVGVMKGKYLSGCRTERAGVYVLAEICRVVSPASAVSTRSLSHIVDLRA